MARGYKTGGRKKGTPNVVTREMRERLMEGETPLDYMMRVMRDEGADVARRDWAAQNAAPYLHARLASVEQKNTLTVSHEDRVKSLAERLAELDALSRGRSQHQAPTATAERPASTVSEPWPVSCF